MRKRGRAARQPAAVVAVIQKRLSLLRQKVVIGLWALTQFIYGVAALGVNTAQTGGIAYWAHIGGFVAGLVLIFVVCGPRLIRRQRERQCRT